MALLALLALLASCNQSASSAQQQAVTIPPFATRSEAAALDNRVGALFYTTGSTEHFCTASVVDSPSGDLIMTAAHCVYDPDRHTEHSGLSFIPGYRGGGAPFGTWSEVRTVSDAKWQLSADPDLDVAFILVQRPDGRTLAAAVGTNRLVFNHPSPATVSVTGYPSDSDTAVSCVGTSTNIADTQLRVACGGFSGGTSGSPWIVSYDRSTRQGSVLGLIGGFQRGGLDADISYSPYFSDEVRALYLRARMS